MPITIENGTMVSGANSYVSVANVTTYATAYGYSTWNAASVTAAMKEQYLLKGMRYIEGLHYRGIKQTKDQPLSFPRSNVYDDDGYLLDENYIPEKLKSAVCEAAVLMIPNDEGVLDVDLQPNITKDNYQTGLQITGIIQEVWNFTSDEIRNRSTVIDELLKDLIRNKITIEIKRG